MPTDVILDVVAKSGRDVDIGDAITGGELERTITGASTLTLEVHDPHRRLIRSPDIRRAIDVKYEGVWFRLVRIAKSDDSVTLTFEDRDVAYLRRHTKPRKVSRSKMTRAQFVRTLVNEVKSNKIGFYCPEINERQPIGKSSEDAKPAKRKASERDDNRERGLEGGADLTVKGVRATSEQRRNGQRVLDVADRLKAGPKATKALVEACIIESLMQNLSGGHADSQGILQVRVSTSGSSAKSRDIEWCCTEFLTKGFWRHRPKGAMALARDYGDWSAGKVAQETQGSAHPERYDEVADEAQKWIDAYGGASGTDTGGTSGSAPSRRRYEFSRGKPAEKEDSWTAITRLAEEVKWRAFMDAGTLYFVSDDRLMKSRAKYTLTEATDGVHAIDFDVDQGRVSAEVRVSCRSDVFDIRIGSVVALRDMGIANGRWLVTTVRQDLFEPECELTLSAPTPKLQEPDAEMTSGGDSGDTGRRASGPVRDRIIAEAEKTLTKKTGFSRYSQAGALTENPTPAAPARTDCSQWVRAVYLRAGAGDPGTYTGAMIAKGKRTSKPRPGDLLISANHVELYVGGDKTYGHGSPPIDEGSVAYHRGRGLYFLTYDFLDK